SRRNCGNPPHPSLPPHAPFMHPSTTRIGHHLHLSAPVGGPGGSLVAQAGRRARARGRGRGRPASGGAAVSSAVDGKAGLAEELRRRRTALGWTLEQVAAQAQVSVGMLSLIETGKRRPSLRSWE